MAPRALYLAACVALGAVCCRESPSTPPRSPESSSLDDGVAAAAPHSTGPAAATELGPAPATTAATSSTATPAPSDDDPLERRSFVRFDEAGKFDRVLVVDEGFERHLRFGSAQSVNQSTVSLTQPETVPMEYIRVAFLGVLYAEQHRRALMVGLGGGTFTTLLRRHFPKMWIDVAEIDPMVKRVAKEFFGVREDDRYKIHIADGAAFVASSPHTYDVALVDAYEGDDIPKQLQAVEFFQSLRGKMAPNGAAVLNLSVADAIEQTLEKRFRATFAEVSCVRTRWGGLVLFGRPTEGLPSTEELRRRARQQSKTLNPSFDLLRTAMKAKARCPRK